MDSIFLAIPVLENVKAHTVDALMRMLNYHHGNPRFRLQWSFITGSRQVHFARNALVNACLNTKADYLAFIDADMTFPDDVLHRLYYNHKDICGVLYKGRIEPHPYNIFYWDKDKKNMVQVSDTWEKPEAKLLEVDAVGTGIMLIKTKVFKEIPKPYFFYEKDKSEDIMFCQKCREHGIKIFVDTTLQCGHIGDQVFI